MTQLRVTDKTLNGNPNQKAILKACVIDRILRVAVRAGRKFGKTFTAVRVAIGWATGKGVFDKVILVAAPEYKYLSDQMVPEFYRALVPEELKGGSWGTAYNKTGGIIELANGSKFLLRSMDNPDAVRPLSVDGLIAEEFGLWSRYAWEECVRATLIMKQAPALFIFTPKGMNQAYELWQRAVGGAKDHAAFHFTSYDGPAPKAAIDAEAATMPEGVRRQEIYAEFLEDLGGVFQGVMDCVAGDKESALLNEIYVIGADVGEVHDFNVATVVRRSTKAVVEQVRFTGVEPEMVVDRFKALSDQYNGAVVLIDNTGLGWAVWGRLKTLGVPVKPYRFTAESKRQLIANLVMMISQRSIRYPDIPELINELQIYEAKQLPSGTVQYGAPSGYHDDCVTALALACWELGHGIQITDFRPVMGRERSQLPAGPF